MHVAVAWTWRILVVAAGVWVLLTVAARLRLVVVPLAVALLLTALLRPAVVRLARRMPIAVASGAVLVAFLAAVVGAIAVIGAQLASELDALGESVSSGVDRLRDAVVSSPLPVGREQLDRLGDDVLTRLSPGGGGVVRATTTVAEVVAGLALALFLTAFFLADGRRLWTSVLALAPARVRTDVDGAAVAAWTSLEGYVRGVVLVAVADALSIGAALFLLDVPLLLALMLLTFLAAFVPIVGAVAAGAVAALVALATSGVQSALLVVLAVVVLQQIEGNVLQPLIVARAVPLHPVAVALCVAVGGLVAGIFGAVVAVPLAAGLTAAARQLTRRGGPPQDGRPDRT